MIFIKKRKMLNKLIITEQQYERIIGFLFETSFDKLMTDVKIGDVVRIIFKNSYNNFKVISNNNGQILMDNIDSGSTNFNNRYFTTLTSLNKGKLEIRKINKVKEKDKLKDISSWDKLNLNDIKDIEIYRDNNLIDSLSNENSPDVKKDTKISEVENEINNSLDLIISELKKGGGVIFTLLDGSEFVFCCDSRGDYNFILKPTSNDKKGVFNKNNKYELKFNISDNLINSNKDVIKTSDNWDSFNLGFKSNNNNVFLKNIIGVEITRDCLKTKEEDTKTKTEELVSDGKIAMDMILNDKNLQKAFYSKPTFWGQFISELKGESNPGKGILPTIQICKLYGRDKINKKLGVRFIGGKSVIFTVVGESVSIPYDSNGPKTFVLNNNSKYSIKVRDYKLKDENTVLEDMKNDYKIIVLSKTDEKDVFNCDVIKYVKNKDGIKEYKKGNVKIKFFTESEGYKSL